MITYEIRVNVARKGARPVWRPLVNEYECDCVWDDEQEARAVLADEGRGPNAMLMRFRFGNGQAIT